MKSRAAAFFHGTADFSRREKIFRFLGLDKFRPSVILGLGDSCADKWQTFCEGGAQSQGPLIEVARLPKTTGCCGNI